MFSLCVFEYATRQQYVDGGVGEGVPGSLYHCASRAQSRPIAGRKFTPHCHWNQLENCTTATAPKVPQNKR
eukprot:4381655-Amphidinium_carterae.1